MINVQVKANSNKPSEFGTKLGRDKSLDYMVGSRNGHVGQGFSPASFDFRPLASGPLIFSPSDLLLSSVFCGSVRPLSSVLCSSVQGFTPGIKLAHHR